MLLHNGMVVMHPWQTPLKIYHLLLKRYILLNIFLYQIVMFSDSVQKQLCKIIQYTNASPQQQDVFKDILDMNNSPKVVLLLDCCT